MPAKGAAIMPLYATCIALYSTYAKSLLALSQQSPIS